MALINYSPKQQAEYVKDLGQKLAEDLITLQNSLKKEFGDHVFIDLSDGVYWKPNPERFYELDLMLEIQIHSENSIYSIDLVRYDGHKFIGSMRDERFIVMNMESLWLGVAFKKYVSEFMRG